MALGFGTYYFTSGMIYEGRIRKYFMLGNWERDQPNGYGKEIYKNGGYFEGNFSEGKKNGRGIMVYPNEDEYEGEFKDNEMHG